MVRRVTGALMSAALLVALGAGTALAGEITGNGQSLKLDNPGKWGTFLHARSECAYSGQEDLQFEDELGNPLETFQKGVPARSQSWGKIPKADRDFLATVGAHPGDACNPVKGAEPPAE